MEDFYLFAGKWNGMNLAAADQATVKELWELRHLFADPAVRRAIAWRLAELRPPRQRRRPPVDPYSIPERSYEPARLRPAA